ncbi:hypothetical protein MVI01_19020 [Myxococcus virescens]|uniref:Uncharacterized protein n=1 Tax=Myxococcus virescens TaxID=83456 RepID=A0A511H996_9BACT|nr:hypothetical protein MVI01_19020 [Myxococcus virescens]SDD79947.1 hypothetical protein SAMN04488504_102749 [Myxococcus virescens]
MRVDDLCLVLVSSLLREDRARWPQRLEALEEELGESWALRRLKVPRAYSLGVRLLDGRELPLAAWLDSFKEGGGRSVRVVDLGASSSEALPAHIAAAFANSGGVVLEVTSGGASSLFLLRMHSSRPHLLTARQLVDFARAQSHADRVFEAWAASISENNQLNDRPAVPASEVPDYLASPDGFVHYDLRGGDLVEELQATLRRHGADVTIPDALRACFYTSDPDALFREMLSPEQQAEFVPSEEQLLLTDTTTPQQFADLVAAQPFAADAWTRIARDQNSFLAEGEPPVTPEGFEARLRTMAPDGLQSMLTGNLMMALQQAARAHGAELVIPEPLRGCIRPVFSQEEDTGRIPGKELLRLQSNPDVYQMYLFHELAAGPAPVSERPSWDEARRGFTKALREAVAFSAAQGSNFADAFKLALFALEGQAPRYDELSPERVPDYLEAVKAAGFDGRPVQVFEDRLGSLGLFQSLGMSEEKLRGLLAYLLSDVFGGMGSWNDQYFETPEAQQQYDAVSARLFGERSAFFVATLNTR